MEFEALADKEDFRHERLKLGGNSVRLITLPPDHNEYNWIDCKIDQYAVHRAPMYIALSYMWGPDEKPFPILLNDKKFYVRRNLYDCLIKLRKHQTEPLVLWIDALCIDQDNIPERNHVVQLMDQVYQRAWQVYVWLGPGDESSDKAIMFLTEVAAHMETVNGSVDTFLETFVFPKAHYQSWVEVLRLFKRDYWSRLWIVQETLLAPSIDIFCGDFYIPWNQVQQVVLLVMNSVDHYNKRHPTRASLHTAITTSLAARMVVRRWGSAHYRGRKETYPSLQVLLETFKDSVCFDSRDEIFGLLSIAGDFCERRNDYIDYNLRPTEVFVKFLRHYLEITNDPSDDQTLYNVRRLSDALRLDPLDILRHRNSSRKACRFYNDLAIDTDDLCLTLPCSVIVNFIEDGGETDQTIPGCILKDDFGSMMSGSVSTPVSPGASTYSISLPGSQEELSKLRRLARSRASQICEAFAIPSTDGNSPSTTSTFKYFTRPISKNKKLFRATFGLTCPSSQTDDFLAKTEESDLVFVARHVGDGHYDVMGTALIHEDSGTMYRLKSSMRRWWGSHSRSSSMPNASAYTIKEEGLLSPTPTTQSSYFSKDPLASPVSLTPSEDLTPVQTTVQTTLNLRFNPLMLLMIVNESNWRKDRINKTTKALQRHADSFTTIQPQGEEDPVLKEFGTRLYTGSAHIDRMANRFRDRTSLKLEEIKELAHHFGEDVWDSD